MALKDFFKTVKHEIVEGYQSFSTPFLKVGGANLTLPYVNGRNQTNDMPVKYPVLNTIIDKTPECFILLGLNCCSHFDCYHISLYILASH